MGRLASDASSIRTQALLDDRFGLPSKLRTHPHRENDLEAVLESMRLLPRRQICFSMWLGGVRGYRLYKYIYIYIYIYTYCLGSRAGVMFLPYGPSMGGQR